MKLREQHGVNIHVPAANIPADDERSNQIRLIGYEHKCEEAKAAIEAIIKELVRRILI